MIQKIFKKRALAGIGGLILFVNHLGQSFFYSYEPSRYFVIIIFVALLYFNGYQKSQKGELNFTKLMSDNLQLTTSAFFSFLIFLLFFHLMVNFSSSSPIGFGDRLQDFLPVMVEQAYEKAIFFIPLSFLFGILFSYAKSKKKVNEDILDEELD